MPLDNPLTLSLQRSTNNLSIKIEKSATSNASNNNNNLEQSNNNNASTNLLEQSINSYSYRPTLHRCNANAIRKYPIKITADNYVPYHAITIQFHRYSYIRYNKSLIRGYIRNLGKHSQSLLLYNDQKIIPNVTHLCIKYYLIKEDGIYQLTYQIYSILKQLKQSSITMKLIKVMVTKLLKLKRHPKKVIYYINEMIRLQYIIPVKLNNNSEKNKCNLYQISVQKSVLFGRTVNK